MYAGGLQPPPPWRASLLCELAGTRSIAHVVDDDSSLGGQTARFLTALPDPTIRDFSVRQRSPGAELGERGWGSQWWSRESPALLLRSAGSRLRAGVSAPSRPRVTLPTPTAMEPGHCLRCTNGLVLIRTERDCPLLAKRPPRRLLLLYMTKLTSNELRPTAAAPRCRLGWRPVTG